MEPDDLLCSRNARPQKALVGRAQWKINQPPSLKRERASSEELLYLLAAALPEERRVLARRGWAGEKDSHFEHHAEIRFSCADGSQIED
jgi:hypothetical protein